MKYTITIAALLANTTSAMKVQNSSALSTTSATGAKTTVLAQNRTISEDLQNEARRAVSAEIIEQYKSALATVSENIEQKLNEEEEEVENLIPMD